MQQRNVADFIFYDLYRKRSTGNFVSDSIGISELIEGWNRDIYVLPKGNIKMQDKKGKRYIFM
ncbi:MAG: hypothetical protein J6039_01465 [Alphaproteobacteria bacterium]|nr:hypothetical protein [Alphaproteobacteria bacterium]